MKLILWELDYVQVPCATKIAKVKKGPQASSSISAVGSHLPASSNVKTNIILPSKVTSLPRSDETLPSTVAVPAPCSIMDVSPSKSDEFSVSLDETMSTCDSFKSPEVEYIDNNDVPAVNSINRKTFSNLYISDHSKPTGFISFHQSFNHDLLPCLTFMVLILQ